MEKKDSNLGKVLSKKDIKSVYGGDGGYKCAYACSSNADCDTTCPSCEKGAWGNQKFCFNGGEQPF